MRASHPRPKSRDRGATAVEYAILVGFVAAVIIAGVTAFGIGVRGLFDSVPPF